MSEDTQTVEGEPQVESTNPLDFKGNEKETLKEWAKGLKEDKAPADDKEAVNPNDDSSNPEPTEPEPAVEKKKEPKKKRTRIFDEPENETQPEPESTDQPEKAPEVDEVPKGAENWKRAKEKHAAELAERDRRIAELESNLTESSSNSPEYQKVLEENKEMRDRLGQLDLANSPDFQEKYTIPAQTKRQQMENILKENEVDVTIDQLLAKSGKELRIAVSEVMDELPALDKGQFQDAFLKFYDISTEGQQALSDADSTRTKIASEVNLNQESAVKAEWDQITKAGNAFLRPIEADDPSNSAEVSEIAAYNEGIDQVLQRATQMAVSDIGQDGAAKICLSGAVGEFIVNHGIPRLQKEFASLEDRAIKAEAKLAKIQQHNPSVNGKPDSANEESTKPQPKPKSEKEVFANFAKNIKAAGFKD